MTMSESAAHRDVEDVQAIADALELGFSPEDLARLWPLVTRRLDVVDSFMEGASAPEATTMDAGRDDGWRPERDEDPYNAWLWRCEIETSSHGLLAGKTVSFKDIVSVAGIPMSLGSARLDAFVPDIDAAVVERVLNAGGRIIGKNATDGPTNSWGNGIPGDRARPLNPHDTERLTGGSSSGSAVAVAAGQVDIAFGGDQAGSIRIPASLCGVYGLKPTYGLISAFGSGIGAEPTMDHLGPLARYAEDIAATLQAVAGYDPRDPRQDRTVPDAIDIMGSLNGDIRGVRIGVVEEAQSPSPEVEEAVAMALNVLAERGVIVQPVSLPAVNAYRGATLALLLEGFRAIYATSFTGAFSMSYQPESIVAGTFDLYHANTEELLPERRVDYLAAEIVRRRYAGRAYARAQNLRARARSDVNDALAEVDVLAMPTCARVAPVFTQSGPETMSGISSNTVLFNYTGHPALSVPCATTGLPVGMQLVGRYYAEATLLNVAYTYQNSVDWKSVIALPKGALS